MDDIDARLTVSMTHVDQAAGIARAELEQPTFAVTRQYLALHTVLVDDEGRAVVARVDDTTEAGAYHVYFGLRDVPYHCVVAVRPTNDHNLAVSWVYIQPATRAYLAIRSADLTPEEVTQRTGLQPTRTKRKGAPIGQHGRGRPTVQHFWALDAPTIPGDLGEKVSTLIAAIERVAPAIASLKSACDIQLTIVYEGWVGNSSLGGIQLDDRATRVLAQVDGALDIDIYAFGPTLSGADDLPSAT